MPIFLAIIISIFGAVKSQANISKLQVGDIILQPLNCWSCGLIEAQENSEFSHMGIIYKVEGEVLVAEALNKVRVLSLKEFLKRNKKGRKAKVIRIKNQKFNTRLMLEHINELIGHPYDNAFRWDNYVGEKESMYCSEFVYKILVNQNLFKTLSPKRLTFNINPEAWDRYFHGNTPRGELGISPEDFNKSSDFYDILFL